MADLYLGHCSAISAQVLVPRESDTVAAAFGGFPAVPFGAQRSCFYDGATTRILKVPQAESNRVNPCSLSEFVHEGFDRKHVGVRTQRTQRRGPHRHFAYVVVDDALARKIVYRNCVAVRCACGERHVDRRGPLMRPRQVPGCQERRIVRSAGPAAVTIAPKFVLPIDDTDRKSTRLNSSHRCISYAVFCLKKKKKKQENKIYINDNIEDVEYAMIQEYIRTVTTRCVTLCGEYERSLSAII